MAELSEEAKEQVVAYMRHQASKSNDDLAALIDRAHGVIEHSLEGVSEEQAKLCPEPGEWCIGDILRHVEKSMRSTADVIEAVGKGEKADLSGMAPVIESGPETLAELREGVARSFDELKSAVRAMPAAAPLTAFHPFFGDLTCREWAAFVYVHARDHAEQIEKAKQLA